MHLQPWWLDAVCSSGAWDVCLATGAGNVITGALPYFITQRWGLKIIRQPPLTSYGGPWVHYPENQDLKLQKRVNLERKILEELVRQLPKAAFFQQSFRPEIHNWLPFQWSGYRQTTRYTYLFHKLNDLELIWAGCKNTLRTDIRKATRSVGVHREPDALMIAWELHLKSFLRKGKRPPYSYETVRSLHDVLLERGQSICFVARDRDSNIPHAALYLAFDARNASVLFTGQDPAFKSISAVWLLFWEAIKYCSEKGLAFDFEGSMEREIERGFRAFGAQLTPYHQIWKAGNCLSDLAFRVYRAL